MAATAIASGAALIGPGLDVVSDALVVLEDNLIRAAGPRGEVTAPAGANTIDATSMLILPGFVDAHVHIGFVDPAEVTRGGVTTARDLAWPPHKIWPLVARSRSDEWDGPTLFAAGPMITVPGGYPMRARWAPRGTGLPVTSAPEARAVVDLIANAGASVIKVALNPAAGPVLDKPLLGEIVSAAHERALPVTGHTHGLEYLEMALDAGMDELAHMLMSPELIPDELIARMAEDMIVVPTLACFFDDALRIAIDNLTHFLVAGGRVVYGTDLGNKGPRPGIDRREVSGMAAAGMSAHAIVAAATVAARSHLGLGDVGALAPGFAADVVAVPAQAREDAHALTDVRMVWRRGRRLV